MPFRSMKLIAKLILKMMGWRVANPMPAGIKKAVIIMAPHTSNLDFIIGRLGFATIGLKARIIIKKESFFFPMGILLRWLGAVPMDRGYSTKTLKNIHDLMEQTDEFFLLITPEGTRKLARNWKKGFYFIAQNSKVPIIMGYLDYRTKTGGFGPVVYPGGNYEDDIRKIEEFYMNKQARFPEHFSLSPQYTQKKSDKKKV
jgi:1-acyl-sn-glycerol-3-phosphate acyltransferase